MEIITVEQVAALLNVKPSWIYARTADGALRGKGRGRKPSQKSRCRMQKSLEMIPHFKAGKLLRFDRDEILAWWVGFHRNGDKPSVYVTEDKEQTA